MRRGKATHSERKKTGKRGKDGATVASSNRRWEERKKRKGR